MKEKARLFSTILSVLFNHFLEYTIYEIFWDNMYNVDPDEKSSVWDPLWYSCAADNNIVTTSSMFDGRVSIQIKNQQNDFSMIETLSLSFPSSIIHTYI